MSRTTKIVLALVVVLAVVGGLGAWYVFGEDTLEKVSLANDSNIGKAIAVSGSWKVAASSRGPKSTFVGYRVDEKFAGGIATKTAVGRTPDVAGTVTVSGDTLEAAKVRADLTTLESDRSQRDAAMHARGLETNTYPNATFTLTKPVRLPKIRAGRVFTMKATGQLTLHNVTRTISADLEAKGSATTFEVTSVIPIKMRDYKIDPPDVAGFVTVQDHGDLELNLTLTRTGTGT